MRRRGWFPGLVSFLTVVALVQVVGVPPAGARWATARSVPGTRLLGDIWCRPDGSCLAVGSTTQGLGAVVVVHSSGAIGPVRPVRGSAELTAIDCVSSGGCIAVGAGPASVFVQIAADGTPGTARSVPGVDDLHDVACPTATTCLATGSVTEHVQEYPYHKRWSLFVVFENGEPTVVERFPLGYDRFVTGIDCPTPTTCMAVHGEVVVLSNVGGTWSPRVTWVPAPDYSGHATGSISCTTSRQCWASALAFIQSGPGLIGVPAIAPVYADGTVGPVRVLTPQSGNAYGISCAPGTSSCTVVGRLNNDPYGFTVGTTRGSPSEITYWMNALWGLWGVSCLLPASCGIVGGNGSNGVFAWKGPIIA